MSMRDEVIASAEKRAESINIFVEVRREAEDDIVLQVVLDVI